MFIVKIEVQPKKKNCFNIYVDRGNGEIFAFSVGEDVLIKHGLRKGMELDELDIDAILHEDQIKAAFNKALTFLGYRMRSEKEVRDYLVSQGIDERVIERVMVELQLKNYVNDKEFAEAFVRTQMKTTLKGPGIIKAELGQKGIENDLIEAALDLFTKERQIEAAYKLAEKQLGKKANISLSQLKQKIEQAMFRKGFSSEVIQAVLEMLPLHERHDQEWEALLIQGEKGKKKYSHLDMYTYRQKLAQFLYRKGFSQELIQQYLQKHLEKSEE